MPLGTIEKCLMRRFILKKLSSFTMSKRRQFFSEGLALSLLRQPQLAFNAEDKQISRAYLTVIIRMELVPPGLPKG